jgi:hypothetical protein
MKSISEFAIGLAAGAGMLAFSAIGASAAIVCSGYECWHTHEAYDYPPAAHVIIHPDDWRWGGGERYAWREHEGRGYWAGDAWTPF